MKTLLSLMLLAAALSPAAHATPNAGAKLGKIGSGSDGPVLLQQDGYIFIGYVQGAEHLPFGKCVTVIGELTSDDSAFKYVTRVVRVDPAACEGIEGN